MNKDVITSRILKTNAKNLKTMIEGREASRLVMIDRLNNFFVNAELNLESHGRHVKSGLDFLIIELTLKCFEYH